MSDSNIDHPDKYRDYGTEPEQVQNTMLYEIAVQLERIATALEDWRT